MPEKLRFTPQQTSLFKDDALEIKTDLWFVPLVIKPTTFDNVLEVIPLEEVSDNDLLMMKRLLKVLIDERKEVKAAKLIQDIKSGKIPTFVRMGANEDGTVFKLEDKVYWHSNGNWGVGYKFIDDVLVSHKPDMKWLHEQPLFKITKKEYIKGEGYGKYQG